MYILNNVKKIYKQGQKSVNVLNGINLTINDGEFLAIMGSSGAGKTTLLNVLTMIDDFDDGEIIFDNLSFKSFRNKERDAYRKEKIGIVFQEYNLIEEMTVLENIKLGQLLSSEKNNPISFESVVDQLGLSDLLEKYPEELSGGERQRVAIARSIVNNSKCIFADEPTGALNRKNATVLLQIFKKLNEEQGKTIVMVTHDPYVASFSNRLVYIKDGIILKSIPRKKLRKEYYEEILHCLEENDE